MANTLSSKQSAKESEAPDVRRQLLETAARHFADFGVQGASQRAIQREVGVNISTANYYFGTKEALYRAVVEESLSRMQAYRRAGLEKANEISSPKARLQALLTCYFGAYLNEATSAAGYNYARIVASLHFVVPDTAAEVIESLVTPVRELYVDALARLFPTASRNRIYEVLRLMVGLMATAPIRLGRVHISKETANRLTEDIVAISMSAFEKLCNDAKED